MFQQTCQISRRVAARFELHGSALQLLSEASYWIIEWCLRILDSRVIDWNGWQVFLSSASCAYNQHATDELVSCSRHTLPAFILRPDWPLPAKNSGRLEFRTCLWISPRFEPGMRTARAWTEAW